ncbi:MAG: hypothetical protein KAI47_11495, partial [Deltaproteobacteria bacterium]|nr:hypothetical protein [Deltaproteobacteria bacterium]
MHSRLGMVLGERIGSQRGQPGSWRAAAIAMAIAILLTTPGCRRLADYPMSDAAVPHDVTVTDKEAPRPDVA